MTQIRSRRYWRCADEPNSRLKGILSAYGPLPFFCHHGRSGEEYDWKSEDTLGPLGIPPSERRICGGWQRMVAALKKRGFYNIENASAHDLPLLRQYQKHLASAAIRQLETYRACLDGTPEKILELGRLRDLVLAAAGKP